MYRKTLVLFTILTAVFLGCSQSRHFALGARLERMGRYNDALGAYQAALLQTRDNDSAQRSQIYYRMGECFIHLNRVREAFGAFQRSATADPRNLDPQLRIGEFLL